MHDSIRENYRMHRQRVLDIKSKVDSKLIKKMDQASESITINIKISPTPGMQQQQQHHLTKEVLNDNKCHLLRKSTATSVSYSIDIDVTTSSVNVGDGNVYVFDICFNGDEDILQPTNEIPLKLNVQVTPKTVVQNMNLERERKLVKLLPDQAKRAQSVCKHLSYNIPEKTLKYYKELSLDLDDRVLHNMIRPRVFLELAVSDGDSYYVGRLVFQLFTEACPSVVMEFVNCCQTKMRENFSFNSVYAPLWLESKLLIGKSCILNGPIMSVDHNVLNHFDSAGILSFPARCLNELYKNQSLDFTLSFSPLHVAPKQRIAFGVLHDGFIELQKLKNLSNGKNRKIVVIECGLMEIG